jgi:ATP-dependent DNA ligase
MNEYRKRSGSTLREYNINVVVEKLRQGMSETDVLNELAMAFCPDTRIDYLNTAKEKLKMEKSESSLTKDTAKSSFLTNNCKNCTKLIPKNTEFCSRECAEQYKKEEKEKP